MTALIIFIILLILISLCLEVIYWKMTYKLIRDIKILFSMIYKWIKR